MEHADTFIRNTIVTSSIDTFAAQTDESKRLNPMCKNPVVYVRQAVYRHDAAVPKMEAQGPEGFPVDLESAARVQPVISPRPVDPCSRTLVLITRYPVLALFTLVRGVR